MKIKSLIMTCGLTLVLAANSALGVSAFVRAVPNGSAFSCSTCHDPVSGPPDFNSFGQAFFDNGEVWNAALARLDSDGDSFTNGQELGDPNGTGTPTVGAQVTNPGNAASHPTPATAPAITTQPASQTVTTGANVTFSVVATGTAPLSYQWMKGGVNIATGTAATLTLNNVVTTDAGSYSVRVSNSAGSITSTAATLTVNPAVVAPAITTQPASQTVTAGANVTFSVVATGTAPLSYQWMKGGVNIATGTAATLTLNNVVTTDAGSYSVRVSNSAGSITSTAATLTVNPAVVAPAITTQPASQTVTAGANVTFSVVATGTAPLSYQWMKGGVNIATGTAATLTLNNVATADAGTYSVRVSNSAGSVTSTAATLTVNPAAVAPAITTQPASQTVTAGANVTFSVVATGTAPLSYQWMKGGANIATGTAATLTLNSVATADAGSYSVWVSNSAGSVTSAAATLTINPATVAPAITTQPVSRTITAGANVTFSVVATGTAPLSYQWMKGGANIATGTAASLTLNSVATADAGSYSVRVSNSAGSVTSAAVTLTVNPAAVAPAITMQPVSQTVTAGANVTFMFVATGTAPLSYQWMKDGANIATATGASLVLSSVTNLNAGSYTVKVSNSAGSVTSTAARLTVNPAPVVLSIALTSPTNGASFTAPADVLLETLVSPGTNVASVQFFDGTNLLGTVTAAPYSMTASNVMAGDHELSAKVTTLQGAIAVAAPVTITVTSTPPPSDNKAPVVRILAPRDNATVGSRVQFVAQAADADGRVTKVEFFAGSTSLGTAVALRWGDREDDERDDDDSSEARPGRLYYLIVNNLRAGQYVITARATDSLGATTSSAPIRLTVKRYTYSWSQRED